MRRLYQRNLTAPLLGAALAVAVSAAHGAESIWAYRGVTGRMIYTPDAEGDRILDFSDVGYHGRGAELLPQAPTVLTVSPVAGDDTASIQAAIDQVASMPIGPDGFRGAVELAAGHFDVATQLNINASGIVLRGAGDDAGGTVLHARSSVPQSVLIHIAGTGSQSLTGSTRHMIDKVVPAGATSFRVDSTAGLAVGDMVRVERPSTAEWISDLGMDQIPPRNDGGQVNQWEPGAINLRFDRVITRIEGDRVFLDAPLANSFSQEYGGGTIRRYTWNGRIQNVGIENLRAESDFASATDENHAWDFVSIDRAQHVWVRNSTSAHFAGSAVVSNPGAMWVTVDNVVNLDPKSQITGERRYTFDLSGQLELVTNSTANLGRHDFVNNSSRPPGPHVFHRSVANNAVDESGPHQRWATGSLFDNVVVEGDQINARNRGNFGTGHGWAGANMVIWNSQADSFIVQNPPTAQNWLIGSTGQIIDDHTFGPQPPGYVDSPGTRVAVDSLYEAQLADSADVTVFRWEAPAGNWVDAAGWSEGLVPDRYHVETRDYLIGDVDGFTYDGPASVDNAPISPAWETALASLQAGPLTGLDDLTTGGSTAFTIGHQLTGERVIHASLALAIREAGGSSAADFVRLFDGDPEHRFDFADLGWHMQINPSGTFVGVLDLGESLEHLQTGAVNVQVTDTAVDWALYAVTVATPSGDASSATAIIDNGGVVEVTSPLGPLGNVILGAEGDATLSIDQNGRLQLAGDYVQGAGGELDIHFLAGIEVAGAAVLGGALRIDLGPGASPAPGDEFVLIEAASIFGDFTSIELPPATPEGSWGLRVRESAVVLGFYHAADFNHDGLVNADDLAAWRAGYGAQAGATHLDGDADGNGAVDGADFLTWQRQLGQGSATLATVPEPGMLALVLGWPVILGIAPRRRAVR